MGAGVLANGINYKPVAAYKKQRRLFTVLLHVKQANTDVFALADDTMWRSLTNVMYFIAVCAYGLTNDINYKPVAAYWKLYRLQRDSPPHPSLPLLSCLLLSFYYGHPYFPFLR